MSIVDVIGAILHGPFGDQPFAVLAWQALVGAAIYGLWRLKGGRQVPSAVTAPVGKAFAPIGAVLRNRYALLVIGLFLPLAELLTGGYLLSVTYAIELYVLLAVGLNIVVGFTGLLDLGYVAFFAVGAYVYGVFASPQLSEITTRTIYFLVPETAGSQGGIHISMLILMPAAGAIAALFGVLIGIPTLRLRGDYLAIVTLGFGEITRIVANNLDEPINITNGPNGVINIDPVWIGNYSFADIHNHIGSFNIPPFLNYYYLVLILIILTVYVVGRLERSRVGRAWAAIREDETAAQVAGINTRNLKLLAYASGGFFGGMAGAVYAAGQHLIAPDSFQLFVSILVLCMVVAGGMGSIPGAVLGAVVIGALYFLTPQLLYLRILIFGALLIILIILRPQGLLPSAQRKRELEEPDESAAPALPAGAGGA